MVIKQLVTAEELWAMPDVPGVRYELVRGELIAEPGTGGEHGLIARRVLRLLDDAAQADDLGEAFGDGVSFVLRRYPDLLRIPDASFVSWERLPDRRVPRGFLYLTPDLAVEIVSPNDREGDVLAKAHEYLEAGSRLVWVLWPDRRAVTVHEPDHPARELGPDDFLDGGDVLPSLSVRVADLFPRA
jgi:Uma2 family endonuclease